MRALSRPALVGVVILCGPLLVFAAAVMLGALGNAVDGLGGTGGPFESHPNVAVVAVWGAVALGLVGALRLARRRRARPQVDPLDDVDGFDRAPSPRRAMRPLGLELLVYAGAIAAMTWPMILHPSRAFIGVNLDPPYYVWLGWKLGALMKAGHVIPLHIPGAVHPFGVNVLLLDGLLSAYVSGWWNLVAGPFLAYNLTLVTGIALNLWSARLLAKTLSDRRVVWVIGALAFATAPAVAANVSVLLPFVFAFTVPLFVREAVLVVRGTPIRAGRLAILLVVAYLCSVYFLVFGALTFAVIVAASRVTWPRARTLLVHAAAGAAIAAVALSPFVVARIHYNDRERSHGGHELLLNDAFLFSGDGLSAVTPPEQLWVDVPFPSFDQGSPLLKWSPVFPGWILLIGLSLVVLVRTRFRSTFVIAALVTWILTLGPSLRFDGRFVATLAHGPPLSWLPYRLLLELPLLGALRVPVRVGLMFAAVLTAMLVVGVGHVFARQLAHSKRSTAMIALAAGLLLVGNLMAPVDMQGYGVSRHLQSVLHDVQRLGQGTRNAALLVVPADCDRADPKIILWQTLHEQPSLGCSTSSAAIPWYGKLGSWARSQPLAALRCDQTRMGRRMTKFDGDAQLDARGVAELRERLGVRFVMLDTQAAGLCPTVAAAIPALRSFRVVGSDRTYTIYDLGRHAR